MKKTTENKTADSPGTEALILQAAEEEFMQKGFAGARTTAIAEAAGVTHAMLHYYFRSKEKLFDKIVGEKIGLMRTILVQSVQDADLPLFDKIRSVIESHLDFLAANPKLPRFMICEVFAQPERMAVVIEQFQAYVPGLLAEIQRQIDGAAERGECRKTEAWSLVLDIVSLNLFSFVAAPLVDLIIGDDPAAKKAFIDQRKKENFDTIMRKLRP